MKNMELYNWCVDTLVKAYMNDELVSGNCYACAVGNLLMQRYRETGHSCWPNSVPNWAYAITTMPEEVYIGTDSRKDYRIGNGYMQEIDHSMLWAWHEIARIGLPHDVVADIEWFFETTVKGGSEDEIMFNRLMAVIDVLDKYFEVDQQEIKSKEKFIKDDSTKINSRGILQEA